MLNDTPNVMTELAPKGPRFVEIIEIMDRPDIPFHTPLIRPMGIKRVKPGLHMVVTVVSTVANMFLTLFQAVLIHVNTLITTSQA